MSGLVSSVEIGSVVSNSDSGGRPVGRRSAEMEKVLASALERGDMHVSIAIPNGERFGTVSSRVRSVARRIGARVYIRKSSDDGSVKVLVMGRQKNV